MRKDLGGVELVGRHPHERPTEAHQPLRLDAHRCLADVDIGCGLKLSAGFVEPRRAHMAAPAHRAADFRQRDVAVREGQLLQEAQWPAEPRLAGQVVKEAQKVGAAGARRAGGLVAQFVAALARHADGGEKVVGREVARSHAGARQRPQSYPGFHAPSAEHLAAPAIDQGDVA